MTWTTIYNDPLEGTLDFNYQWKPNHEYMIYLLGIYRDTELELARFATLDGSLLPTDYAYVMRMYDCHVAMSNSTNKNIYIINGDNISPIVKILERPMTVGPTSEDSENWEHVPNPSLKPGKSDKYNWDWEGGYEYFIFSKSTRSIGTHKSKNWITCSYIFQSEAMNEADLGSRARSKGTAGHCSLFGGYLRLLRNTSDLDSPTGRGLEYGNVNANLAYIYRRKIKIVDNDQTMGWKVLYTNLPTGLKISDTAYNWPDGQDLVFNHTDPEGTNEIASPYFYTDTTLVNNESMKLKWGWTGAIVNMVGSSAQLWLRTKWAKSKGYKWLKSKGGSTVKLLQVYQRIHTTSPTVIVPEPTPEPNIPCEDRCYMVDTVWQQTTRVELYFVNPPDWANRTYTFDWGGDIGNGEVQLEGVEDGGRIAIISFTRNLQLADADSSVQVNITCNVTDKEYESLGVSDLAECMVTFELPCVRERNKPNVSIEDIQIVEQTLDGGTGFHLVPIRITLDEAYDGLEPICVDWKTVDGTAASDNRVQALAYDDLGKPFITVIESDTRRVYIDGAFPKWYNNLFPYKEDDPIVRNTWLFTQNLHTWLTNGRTTKRILLLGDSVSITSEYNVKGAGGTSFRVWWEAIASMTASTLDTMYIPEVESITDKDTYLNSFDCIIYYSTQYTANRVISEVLVEAMSNANKAGVGIACISDHGSDDGSLGFFRGANDFLFSTFGINIKGNVDRQSMNLLVENFSDHELWTGLAGKFSSGGSEAYVDAIDQDPDFYSDSGTVCFGFNESEKVIEIKVIGDTLEEENEYFDVVLTNSDWAPIVKGIGRVTIVDDDAEPCGLLTPSGGQGVTETIHALGPDAGQVTVSYEMYSVPDMMEIFYDGVIVATTGGLVSNKGTLKFDYPGIGGGRPTTCMVRMTGNSSSTSWNYSLGCPEVIVGGSGSGCIVFGTYIQMADGTYKLVEDIVEGDRVISIRAISSPDSTSSDDYRNWSEDNLEIEFTVSNVVSNVIDTFDSYYRITGKDIIEPICLTYEHPLLARRESSWMWRRAEDLIVGDILLHGIHGEIIIESIENIIETVNTANLNVEEVDTYLANGFLVHNADAKT